MKSKMQHAFHSLEKRQVPLVMQTEASECGLACLAMIGNYHGHELSLPGLRRRFSTSLNGVTLARIVEIAHVLGLKARGLRAELDQIKLLKLPCILHWNLNHFVVLCKVGANWIEIHDPACGTMRMRLTEVSRHFTGVALEVERGVNFEPESMVQRVTLRALTGPVSGFKRVLAQVFGLALIIEVLGLVLPFQLQWVLDRILPTSDKNLLIIVAVGFFVILAARVGLTLARGWIISWLGATLNAQWINNLFGHLLRLPLDYFEKRHIGDVVSRFGSIRMIQSTLTGSFIATMLDGIMGALALVILVCYSLPLTLFVTAVFLVYSALRALAFHKQRQVNEEQLVYRARQDSELMESVRGVRAIKLANKQSARCEKLINATIESARRDMQIQRINLTFSTISEGLFGTQRALLISFGAWLCLDGRFSAGMIIAFISYADQFSTKMGSVIDKVVELKMLALHRERVADIALTEVEPNEYGLHSGPEPVHSICVKNLSFRYAEGESWILRNIDLNIEAGESIAVVGPSGCGKTTLVKLILGLLQPTEGTIEVGGLDVRKYGLQNYRRMVAAVMQDDQLFAGSIADNISFFDEAATMESIESAATNAAIHAEIARMPMGYESLVGDMGSSLSGGQRQRVILARALYRKPRIIVLDEATSDLDVPNEQAINATIKMMNMTRIIIAHRPETIASASRIVRLDDGCLIGDAQPSDEALIPMTDMRKKIVVRPLSSG